MFGRQRRDRFRSDARIPPLDIRGHGLSTPEKGIAAKRNNHTHFSLPEWRQAAP
jgi:hypothetical protein